MNLSVNSKKSSPSFYIWIFSKLLLNFPQILQNITTTSIDEFDHDKIQNLSIVSKIINYKLTADWLCTFAVYWQDILPHFWHQIYFDDAPCGGSLYWCYGMSINDDSVQSIRRDSPGVPNLGGLDGLDRPPPAPPARSSPAAIVEASPPRKKLVLLKASEIMVLGCEGGVLRCRLCSRTLCHQF